jgi:predicted PurR-regulated permease PerM
MDAPAGTQAGTAPFVERRATPDGRRVRPPTSRVALVFVGAVVVAIALWAGRAALAPFIVGLLIVYLLDPPVEWLSRLRIPRFLAVLLVYAGVMIALFEALNLTLRPLVQQLQAFAQDLPTLIEQLDAQLQQLSDVYRGLELPPALRDAVDSWVREAGQGLADIDPSVLLPVFGLTAGFVGTLFGYLIIPVWAFYLLKDRPGLSRAFDRSLPEEWREDVWQVIRIIRRVFGQWVRGQVFLGLTVGVATFVGLLILDQLVDPIFGRFAVLLALIAGVLELLPIIGPIIAAIPAVLLALTAGPEAAAAALLLYFAVQQVENSLLVPKIQGDAVELHPSVVMFALIIGATIYGLLGAILALPITAAARNVYRYLFRRLSDVPPPPAMAAAGIGRSLVAEARLAGQPVRRDAAVGEADRGMTFSGDTAPTPGTAETPASASTSPTSRSVASELERKHPGPGPDPGRDAAPRSQDADASPRTSGSGADG